MLPLCGSQKIMPAKACVEGITLVGSRQKVAVVEQVHRQPVGTPGDKAGSKIIIVESVVDICGIGLEHAAI